MSRRPSTSPATVEVIPGASLRSDAAATRRQLVEAVGELLSERGREFGLADVAARSRTSLATTYRHLGSLDQAVTMYLESLVTGWAEAVTRAAGSTVGVERLTAICRAWVRQADEWGPAAVWIRSPWGLVERYTAQDQVVTTNWAVLAPVVQQLVALGRVPPQPVEYAVLMWNTIFDERVIMDLRRGAGWSQRRVTRWLTQSLLQVLAHPATTTGPGPGPGPG